MLQAEYSCIFTDPSWEIHIQALHSTASRWHLTGQHHQYVQHSIQIVFELAVWEPACVKVFAYAEIATVVLRVVNHGQVRDRSPNCCYYGLLSPSGTSPTLRGMIQAKQDHLSAQISQLKLLSVQILFRPIDTVIDKHLLLHSLLVCLK